MRTLDLNDAARYLVVHRSLIIHIVILSRMPELITHRLISLGLFAAR